MQKKIHFKLSNTRYVPIPKFYTFPSKEARERVLCANFLRVNQDVKDMVKDVLKYKVKK